MTEEEISSMMIIWHDHPKHLIRSQIVFDSEHDELVTTGEIKDTVAILFEPVHLGRIKIILKI